MIGVAVAVSAKYAAKPQNTDPCESSDGRGQVKSIEIQHNRG